MILCEVKSLNVTFSWVLSFIILVRALAVILWFIFFIMIFLCFFKGWGIEQVVPGYIVFICCSMFFIYLGLPKFGTSLFHCRDSSWFCIRKKHSRFHPENMYYCTEQLHNRLLQRFLGHLLLLKLPEMTVTRFMTNDSSALKWLAFKFPCCWVGLMQYPTVIPFLDSLTY